MLVGHEPDLSALVAAPASGTFGRPFEKAMVVGVHLGVDRAATRRLRFVLEPKTLKLDDGGPGGKLSRPSVKVFRRGRFSLQAACRGRLWGAVPSRANGRNLQVKSPFP